MTELINKGLSNNDKTITVACLQMSSSPDVAENLSFIEQALDSAPKIDLLALPENFAQMPKTRHQQHVENVGSGHVQDFLKDLARRHNMHLIAGSLPVAVSNNNEQEPQKPYARCLIVAPSGETTHYDKLHLFDVDTSSAVDSGAKQRYRESDTYQRGPLSESQVAPRTLKIGTNSVRLGASICYDLRFPELYRGFAAQGVDIISVPSAFTYETGRVHWECLLRARAIENQAFVIAPAQVGVHASGRQTWGHSSIIDPWGTVLAVKAEGVGLVCAGLDLSQIESLKQSFPVARHKRLKTF